MALIGATLVECSIFSCAIQILSERKKKIVCIPKKLRKKQWQVTLCIDLKGQHKGFKLMGANNESHLEARL